MTDPRNRIYAYALLKSFYDEGKDYIDAFRPLLISCLPQDGRRVSLAEIQAGILHQTSLEIPELALGVIATRAKRAGFVFQRNHLFGRTDKGKRLPGVDADRSVERRINSLVDDAKQYMESEEIRLESEEVWNSLQVFVATNLQFFEQFAGSGEQVAPPDDLSVVDTFLLEYCCAVEESNPEQFRTLRDIVLGSVIATSVYITSFAEVGRKFDRTVVYLDSNILFNVLDMHYEQFNKPVREMFELMKTMESFEFRVFDFTVDEVIGVLSGFSRRSRTYAKHIRVNTILSSLRSKGWSPSTVRQFAASIEERLAELGIRVDPTDVHLKTYSPDPAALRGLERYKPHQPDSGQNHDLAAIERVRSARQTTPRQIESAEVFLLTADLKLARYNFVEGGHREANTVSEVVPAGVLTTFLWLKDPARAAEVPLRSIIAMHSKDLLVDRDVWNKFFTTLRDLRRAKRVDIRGTSVLLFDPQLEDALRVARPNQVTAEWVLSGVEQAKRRLEQEFETSASERENEILTHYEAEMEAQETSLRAESDNRQMQLEATEERVLSGIQTMRMGIKHDSEKEARRLLFLIAGLVSIAIGGGVYVAWKSISPLAGGISIAAVFIGAVFSVLVDTSRIRHRVFLYVFDKVYRYRLARSRISDLEDALGNPASGDAKR